MKNTWNIRDISGMTFGRLTVVIKTTSSRTGKSRWTCKCECGKYVDVDGSSLKSGNTLSCGCIKKEIIANRNTTHGLCMEGGKKTRIYGIWSRMRQRCRDKNTKDYARYGGSGITVCNQWDESFGSFHDWAISNGYRDNLTIDRKNNDIGYNPENCRWILPAEQASNKRNNHIISLNDEIATIAEWSRKTGIDGSLLRYRIKKWGSFRALTTPVRGAV